MRYPLPVEEGGQRPGEGKFLPKQQLFVRFKRPKSMSTSGIFIL